MENLEILLQLAYLKLEEVLGVKSLYLEDTVARKQS